MNSPLSETESERIMALPLMSEILPHKFANGSVVEDLAGQCSGCGREMLPSETRTEVTTQNAHSVAVIGYMPCYECRIITPLELRLADDGTYLVKAPGGWRSGRYADVEPVGWWSRIKAVMGGTK